MHKQRLEWHLQPVENYDMRHLARETIRSQRRGMDILGHVFAMAAVRLVLRKYKLNFQGANAHHFDPELLLIALQTQFTSSRLYQSISEAWLEYKAAVINLWLSRTKEIWLPGEFCTLCLNAGDWSSVFKKSY